MTPSVAVYVLVWTAVCVATVACLDRVGCKKAYVNCNSVNGCKMAIDNYHNSCRQLMHGEESRCSKQCQESIVALIISDTAHQTYGRDVARCMCTDKYCKKVKGNVLAACDAKVNATLHNIEDEIQTCSLARSICLANTPCQTAYDVYMQYCGFSMKTCTNRCNRAARILYRERGARFLRQCTCEDDSVCSRDRRFLETYCWGMRRKKVTQPPPPTPDTGGGKYVVMPGMAGVSAAGASYFTVAGVVFIEFAIRFTFQ